MGGRRKKLTQRELREIREQKKMNAIARITAFYRANPHRFAKDYLNIDLRLFQKILIFMMNWSTHFIFFASRGLGKTFLLAIFCCIRCILYPGTKIAVAAPTRTQGNQVLEKIEKELMKKSYNLWYEIKYIKYNNNIGECYFKNGSYIKIVTMADTARSARANIIFIDEFVKSKKDIIDGVIKKFLVAEREPKFYSKPEYKNYPKERNKEIYCSSAYTKANWGYTKLKGYVDNIILSDRRYFVCTLPYQIAILEGLLSRAQVEDEMSENDFNALTWSMEMECLFYGDSKESFYKFDNINARRVLKEPYPKLEDVIIGNAKVPKLQRGERRILSVDVALMASTKHDNDASSIMINSAIRGSGTIGNYISNYRLIDSREGLTTNDLGMLIMRYFYLYDCTDIALDTNGRNAPYIGDNVSGVRN